MLAIEKVLSRLECVRKSGSGWVARCPAHKDHNPSLSINETDDGHVLLHCFTGCPIESITDAIDMKLSELFEKKNDYPMSTQPKFGFENTKKVKGFDTPEEALRVHESTLGQHSAKWDYHNIEGVIVGWAVRWETEPSKTFRPVSLIDGQWKPIAMPSFRPLYRLLDLAGAELVIVTEGEKAADAARRLGFVATTSFGGSGAPHHTSWQPLAGKKVVILPDNDEPGQGYAEKVVELLSKLIPKPTILILNLPDLPEKGDIVDWIENHGDAVEPDTLRANLLKLIEATPTWKPTKTDPKPDLSFKPFPLDILPEPIRSFVRDGAESIMCDPTYIVFPLLTAIGAAIGNKYRLKLKSEWQVPPILWTMIVGKSGSSKTPAFTFALKQVYDRQAKAYNSFLTAKEDYEVSVQAYKRDMSAWQKGKGGETPPEEPKPPILERYFGSDTTMEAIGKILSENQKGFLLSRDELAGLFGNLDRYASRTSVGADSPNLLSMFNAGQMVIDRKTAAGPLFIDKAAVSITGGIQPGILCRLFGREHQESGMAARFLFAYPDPIQKEWRQDDQSVPNHAAIQKIYEYCYDLPQDYDDEGRVRPIPCSLTKEARELWAKYYNEHNQKQLHKEGSLAAAWSKLEEYPARIALIIHFIRRAAEDKTLSNWSNVDRTSLEIGIRLVEWCKHETERIYAMLDGASVGVDKNEQKLISFIKSKNCTVTKRQVQQGCRWLRDDSETAQNALEQLVQKGLGKWEIKGERQTFILNPDPPENLIAPEHEPPRETPRDSDNSDLKLEPPTMPQSVDVVDAVDVDILSDETDTDIEEREIWETDPLFPEIPRLPD